MNRRLLLLLMLLIPLCLKAGTKVGDANGDGTVNAADIVEVVNYIMGNPSNAFKADGADVNHDGSVNAADIVGIVTIIMEGSQETEGARNAIIVQMMDGSTNVVKLEVSSSGIEPCISFEGDEMVIYGSQTLRVKLSDVRRYYFGNDVNKSN